MAESILDERITAIKLVSYSDSSDDDATEALEPQRASTPVLSLVSLDTNSNAVIKPVRRAERSVPLQESKVTEEGQHEDGDKERCQSNICKMKKPNSRTWWVSCCRCGQWFHIRCVNLTKAKAQNESFTCPNC